MEITYTKAVYANDSKQVIDINDLCIDGVVYGFVRANIETTVIGKMFQDYLTKNNIELEVAPSDGSYITSFTDDEMLKHAIVLAVQATIDDQAQSRGYDNANSCISYYNSTDPVFAREAKAMTAWRDKCWRTCYNLLDDYLARKIARPTVDSVIESLPKMDWGDE